MGSAVRISQATALNFIRFRVQKDGLGPVLYEGKALECVSLSRSPLVRKYHGSPTVGVALSLQTAQSRKWQVRTGNENILISKDTQQVSPRGHRSSRVSVEHY